MYSSQMHENLDAHFRHCKACRHWHHGVPHEAELGAMQWNQFKKPNSGRIYKQGYKAEPLFHSLLTEKALGLLSL